MPCKTTPPACLLCHSASHHVTQLRHSASPLDPAVYRQSEKLGGSHHVTTAKIEKRHSIGCTNSNLLIMATKKDIRCTIRFSESEWETIENTASELGIPPSTYLRTLYKSMHSTEKKMQNQTMILLSIREIAVALLQGQFPGVSITDAISKAKLMNDDFINRNLIDTGE
jgi:predicted DNA binding CopG/RHH family protein